MLTSLVPLAKMTPTETNALLFGLISLGFGILILFVPRVLNYLVALYLILIGLVGILRAFS
jgi:Protein of unknown function (DUF3096)